MPYLAQVASFLHFLFWTHCLAPQSHSFKVYWSCLASVLTHTGKRSVVCDRNTLSISDMVSSSVFRERPRVTEVLPEWDLGMVLEACYDPLSQASVNQLGYKTAYLLAMASVGRHRELEALVFDPKYLQFRPHGAGVMLYFSPAFICKNSKPTQMNPCLFQRSLPR